MRGDERARARYLGPALLAAGIFLAVGILVALIASTDSDDEVTQPPPSTTTSIPPTTTAPPLVRSSLVSGEEPSDMVMARLAEVVITAGDLRRATQEPVPAEFPVILDEQLTEGGDAEVLVAQVQLLANQLGPVAVGSDEDAVLIGTPQRADGALEIPVLVINVAAESRRLVHADVVLRESAGPLTVSTRFFGDRRVLIPGRSAFLALLRFPPGQVERRPDDATSVTGDMVVEWEAAPSGAG